MNMRLLPVLLSLQVWKLVSSDTRIVGGEEARGQFPYAVSLQSPQGFFFLQDSHYCGGSLIGRNVVLSAA